MKRRRMPEPKLLLCMMFCLLVLILMIFRILKPQTEAAPEFPIAVLMPDGSICSMELEEFLIGVTAAEMPASFEPEALKAQAVAARTYILAHCPPYGENRHEGAAVCCDSTHCQAWLSKEKLAAAWGGNYDEYYKKISDAVTDTEGMILCRQGDIAQTPFFSTCGGSTESAAACWGAPIPYLIAANCGHCTHSPRFSSHKVMSVNTAASLLDISADMLPAMYTESYTEGGRVEWLNAGGRSISGTKVRSLLELDSAAFTWLIIGDNIVFSTIGYGHGVGLCQYGADGMAKKGCAFEDILQHYYPGTAISHIY